MVDDSDYAGRSERSRILPESIRRALVSGLSALFMSEEGIRNMLSDMRLPKDAMAYLVQQTERTRRELFRVISAELSNFLKNADLTQEMRKAFNGMKVQVRAEVRFIDDKPPTTALHVQTDADAAARPKRKKKGRRSYSAAR